MDLLRGPIAQRLVQAIVIVEVEVVFEALNREQERTVVLDVDLLLFNRAPESFNKDISKAQGRVLGWK
jgi:hypothetical protein